MLFIKDIIARHKAKKERKGRMKNLLLGVRNDITPEKATIIEDFFEDLASASTHPEGTTAYILHENQLYVSIGGKWVTVASIR